MQIPPWEETQKTSLESFEKLQHKSSLHTHTHKAPTAGSERYRYFAYTNSTRESFTFMNIVVIFNILSLKYSVVIYILPSMKLHIFSKLWIKIVLHVEHIT